MATFWITVDGEKIATFCDWAFYQRYQYDRSNEVLSQQEVEKRWPGELAEFGEFAGEEMAEACWILVDSSTPEDIFDGSNTLLSALGMLDGRIGQRRLASLDGDKMHHLVCKMLELRIGLEAEYRDLKRAPGT